MHVPADKSLWLGRVDSKHNKERIGQVVTLLPEDKLFNFSGISLCGFCSDEGVRRNSGRDGASDAPEKIRKYIASLPIGTLKNNLFDHGNIKFDPDMEAGQKFLARFVEESISSEGLPIILGGGHETAWGTLQGLYTKYQNLEVVNFDAHFDLRECDEQGLGSSGTPFYQAAKFCESSKNNFIYNCIGIGRHSNTRTLFDRAKFYEVSYLTDEECHNISRVDKLIESISLKENPIYITICMDVLSSSYAPGVSAPNSGGIEPFTLIYALRKLMGTGRVVAIDIVETNPRFDINDMTSRLAAKIVWECLQCL